MLGHMTHSTPKHLSSGHYGPGSVGSQPPASPVPGHSVPASPYTHPMQSPASVAPPQSPAGVLPPPSPAQHQFTAPSPAPPQSPVGQHLQMKSPAPLPPPSPANILYAKSPAAHIPPPSPRSASVTPAMSPQAPPPPSPVSVSNNSIFLSAGPSMVPGATVLTQPIQLAQSAAGQMFQLQLQPNVSVQSIMSNSTKLPLVTSQSLPLTPTKNGSKQPQLLPKPSQQKSQPIVSNKSSIMSSSMTVTPTTVSTSVQMTGQPQWITGQAGQPVIMGQVVQSVPAAAGQSAPLLIQQPQTNMMIIRPGATPVQTVQAAPTLVPVNGLGGQFIVQQQPGQTVQQVQPGQVMPNVKLITPQGRMQMQKIQTPSGPQLIAVPIGQTLIQGPNGQLLAQAGQNIITNPPGVQFQPNIALPLSSANILTSQAPGQSFTLQNSQALTLQNSQAQLVTTPIVSSGGGMVSMSTLAPGNIVTHPSVIQPTVTPLSSSSVISSPVSPTKKKKPKKKKKEDDLQNKSQGVVDLGALMKDVGLDFGVDDFGFGGETSSGSQQNLDNSLNSSQNSSSSDLEADMSTASQDTSLLSAQPNSIPLNFAQIVSQPLQLQASPAVTAAPAATIQLPGAAAGSGLRLSTPTLVSGGQASVPTLVPGQVNNVTAQPQSLQLVQGPDGNFILQTNPAPSIIGMTIN